ncbi:MAG: branched-chain amino acid transporter permease [Massilia sp.]|jgi:branched-chain amino acid transport system permease protein|nr:branched-chain amino acid transporter permease [Massilia sp.]MDB5948963.1 branched-chain amino acid transporter permease [Massilia sp.]
MIARIEANPMKTRAFFLVLFLAGLAAPAMIYPVFLMKLLCFGLFAAAFNLLLGFAGLLSFGHAAFLGVAGYVCGYMTRDAGWGPGTGILAGTVAAALLGWGFGILAIRRAGIYFSMITLALAQMVFFLAQKLPITSGEDGFQGVPRGLLFGVVDLSNNTSLYYFVYAIFCFGLFVIHRTVHSPYGQILKAIRENEPRAISLGYDVPKFKLLAFVISAGLAGLAGATKTVVFQLTSLTDVHWHTSGEVVLMTLLGGMGTIFGPVIGAATIVGLQTELADKVGSWVTVIMGVIFVLCVLMFRRGIVGEFKALVKRIGIN